MDQSFSAEEKGKKVVAGDGENIGVITNVKNDIAYVDPSPEFKENYPRQNWEDSDEGKYPLLEKDIETITSDEIVTDWEKLTDAEEREIIIILPDGDDPCEGECEGRG